MNLLGTVNLYLKDFYLFILTLFKVYYQKKENEF